MLYDAAASSWLSIRHVSFAATTTTTMPTAAAASFLLLCSKPSISCSSNTPNPLKRRYSNNGSSSEAPPSPPDVVRRWIKSDHPLASQDRFTVASYNILGDRNAYNHRDMYGNVPALYLKWDHRKRVICDEISGWNSDVVCLQEVDKYLELSSNLAKLGYTGSYKRRTGDTVDGCATFWKSQNLRLLDEESIEYKGYGLRDNVAQLSVFEMHKDRSRKLVIGNIHVLYSPRRGEIKLGQIRFLMSRAQVLSERWGNAPVVLCGDFNITPQSAIYKFLSTSELNIMSYDRTELSGQKSCHPTQVLGVKQRIGSPLSLIDGLLKPDWTSEEIRVATGNSGSYSVVHPLKLNSSYAMVQGTRATRGSTGEPVATSYHSKFLGTVDYLWYSDGLVPTGVIDTVPLDTLLKIGSLPCKKVGSDHLALVSEFSFTPRTKEANNTIASKT